MQKDNSIRYSFKLLHKRLVAFRIFIIIFVLMKEGGFNSKELSQVQRISEKLSQLGILYESALVQNKKLNSQVQALKSQLIEKNNEINELKTKYKSIQFSRNIELTSKDVKETRKMVNNMLREIDNCIALIKR